MADDQSKRLLAEEIARQTAPDKRCTGTGPTGKQCLQIVKVGTLCPACATKVQ